MYVNVCMHVCLCVFVCKINFSDQQKISFILFKQHFLHKRNDNYEKYRSQVSGNINCILLLISIHILYNYMKSCETKWPNPYL